MPDEEWTSPNIYEDNPVGLRGIRNALHTTGTELPVHDTWFFYLARICNHCSYPACLAACPRQAIYKRPEDGIVLIDQEQCRGYRKCVKACPYNEDDVSREHPGEREVHRLLPEPPRARPIPDSRPRPRDRRPPWSW